MQLKCGLLHLFEFLPFVVQSDMIILGKRCTKKSKMASSFEEWTNKVRFHINSNMDNSRYGFNNHTVEAFS